MNLIEFIQDAESRYFRSNSDTGAAHNALFVWNRLRKYAGLSQLTHDDLRQRQVDEGKMSMQDIKDFEEWYRLYNLISRRDWAESEFVQALAEGKIDETGKVLWNDQG